MTNPIQAAIDALKAVEQEDEDDNSHVRLSHQTNALVGKAIASLAAIPVQEPVAWRKEPPTEQGWYWHWNGDPDHQPIPTSALYSGTAGACFVSAGQLGITEAIFCDQYGGYWMRMHEPSVHQNASPLPAVQQEGKS